VFIQDIFLNLNSKVFESWCKVIHSAFLRGVEYRTWSALLFEMFAGLPASKTLGVGNDSMICGAQSNGIAMASTLIVDPDIQSDRSECFYISRGRNFNLPVDEDGFIRASAKPERIGFEHRISHKTPTEKLVESIRLDVEPCRQSDYRTVAYVVRSMGCSLGVISIFSMLRAPNVLSSICDKPEHQHQAESNIV
jgi:hypothetical protein